MIAAFLSRPNWLVFPRSASPFPSFIESAPAVVQALWPARQANHWTIYLQLSRQLVSEAVNTGATAISSNGFSTTVQQGVRSAPVMLFSCLDDRNQPYEYRLFCLLRGKP